MPDSVSVAVAVGVPFLIAVAHLLPAVRQKWAPAAESAGSPVALGWLDKDSRSLGLARDRQRILGWVRDRDTAASAEAYRSLVRESSDRLVDVRGGLPRPFTLLEHEPAATASRHGLKTAELSRFNSVHAAACFNRVDIIDVVLHEVGAFVDARHEGLADEIRSGRADREVLQHALSDAGLRFPPGYKGIRVYSEVTRALQFDADQHQGLVTKYRCKHRAGGSARAPSVVAIPSPPGAPWRPS